MSFATVEDVELLFRPLSTEEKRRAEALIPVVESTLRNEARKVGKNLTAMVEKDPDLAMVAKSVTVDVVSRTLMTSTDREPMTQFTQTAGPFSASGTFLSPGGGLFIKKAELDRLGLRKQQFGVVNLYGPD